MSRRVTGVALAVLVTAAIWGVLAYLSRIPELWAIEATRYWFGWAIVETAVAVCVVIVALAREPKMAAFRCIMVVGLVVVAVGMAEAGALLKLFHWQLIFEKVTGEETRFGWEYEADPERGWRRHANLRFTTPSLSDLEAGWSLPPERRETLTFTYDGWGYRNPTTVNQADVVLIGDSYVEGANIDDGQTVARRLEARIGRPVESMGVAGYGALQELTVLEQDAKKLDPKVVVWFFFEGNDLYDDIQIEAMRLAKLDYKDKSREGMAHYHKWDQRSFVIYALRHLRRALDPVFPNHAPYYGFMTTPGHKGEAALFADYAAFPWTDYIETRWAQAAGTLRLAATMSRERGVKLLFAFLPIKERVYWPYVEIPEGNPARGWSFWPIRDKFNAFCQAASLPCLDLTPVFQKDLEAGNIPYLRTDTHWSAHGHDLVAETLRTEFDKRGWLSLTAPVGGKAIKP